MREKGGDKLWKIFCDGAESEACKPPKLVAGVSRRTFLEALGYSAAALALSSCRPPEQKIVPYLRQPVELTPGVASWYASTCGGCSAACGVLVKVRDGRPIKLEGNPEHPLSRGGLCAVAHALVFSLYDAARLHQPLINQREATWEQIDAHVTQRLTAIRQQGGKVRVLSGSITSPTSRTVCEKFLGQFADGKRIVYEPVSMAAIRQGHLRSHSTDSVPFYRFDKARLVVSFDADFLGTWISPVQYTRDYAGARSLQGERREMLRHIQFESRMSLTGSNADQRIVVSPDETMGALLLLARLVAEKAKAGGGAPAPLASFDPAGIGANVRRAVEQTATDLSRLGGESLVVAGANDADAQYVANFINQAVGSYGKTLDLTNPSAQEQASDREMVELVREMNEGQVAVLIISGVNPAYDFFDRQSFINSLPKVPLKISLNPYLDESSSLADYVCPQHHFLEAWDDAEPARGIFSLSQPTIAPLFQTRAYQESLLRWSGDSRSFYDVLRESWREKLFPQKRQYASFEEFWDRSLHDGVFATEVSPSNGQPAFVADGLVAAVERLSARASRDALRPALILYEKVALRDGAHGNNPWLHELPDPITKVTWDNYASMSSQMAERMGLEEGRVIRISKGSSSIELPVLIQPGQHDQTIAIALGYGRTKAGRAGNDVGVNAYSFVTFENETFQYFTTGVNLEKTTNRAALAKTQIKNSSEGRPLIREFTLAEYIRGHKGEESVEHRDLWDPHQYPEYKWGMVVDLSACTGCSACVLSCQAENNVAVVGRDEVRRQREMHWIRIDRYYEGASDQTRVNYQPVLCQHCDNASCETVCPVLATVHSSEGLNMQVYNRCVGTRYCANNCPYKVRRFNWFDNQQADSLANLALNPDVTVRSRGVMEKCTFCVQRIEEVKIRARNEGRGIRDGEIQPACQQSCPAGAIVFGDLKDLESRVARLKRTGRNYVLLEELNMRPPLSYLARVRNDEEKV